MGIIFIPREVKMVLPLKGTEIYLTMKNGKVYQGIYQWYKPFGKGRIKLCNVKCNDSNHVENIVSKKFWISKIINIKVSSVR